MFVSISGGTTHIAPRNQDVALAVARIPSDENVDQLLSTAKIEGTTQTVVKPQMPEDKGFDVSASSFGFEYQTEFIDVRSKDLAVSFKAGRRAVDSASALPVTGLPALPATDAMDVVPLRLARAGVHYEFQSPVTPDHDPLTGDDFEVIDSADNIATRAASGTILPVPQQALDSSSPAPNGSAAPKTFASPQIPAAPQTPDSPLVVATWKAAAVPINSALVLTADALTINLQQQEKAFKRMSVSAQRLLSDSKILLAHVAKQQTAETKSGVTAAPSGVTTVNAKVDDATVHIDKSTAKMVTLTYGSSAGLMAEEADVQIVMGNPIDIPVLACRMNSFNLRPEGVMSVEGLALEAGKLGNLLLFKLQAQGVGYTAEAREMVLVKWSTELAGKKVMGGEKWAGVLEKTTDGEEGAATQRVVRRIVVPPGVQLTQVFRLAKALPKATKEQEPLQRGIVTLRVLDTSSVTASGQGGSIASMIPPAGFGLDFLPGSPAGFCFDFAVQPQSVAMPGMPTREQGLAVASNILRTVFRR